jgi:hypothetical protein
MALVNVENFDGKRKAASRTDGGGRRGLATEWM